jgi:hypothetical protein
MVCYWDRGREGKQASLIRTSQRGREVYMGSSWSGFQPQNEVAKLDWAVMEACHFEMTTQALELLLSSPVPEGGDNEDLGLIADDPSESES